MILIKYWSGNPLGVTYITVQSMKLTKQLFYFFLQAYNMLWTKHRYRCNNNILKIMQEYPLRSREVFFLTCMPVCMSVYKSTAKISTKLLQMHSGSSLLNKMDELLSESLGRQPHSLTTQPLITTRWSSLCGTCDNVQCDIICISFIYEFKLGWTLFIRILKVNVIRI